jgi:hypothetical protein
MKDADLKNPGGASAKRREMTFVYIEVVLALVD